MKPIAIFYHAYFGGGSIPCDHDNVTRIVTEQISLLVFTDLAKLASVFVVGVSGDAGDAHMVSAMAPTAKVVHHQGGSGELPTMKLMQDFCKLNPDHLVLYLHTKGAIHNGNPTFETWRACMQRVVLGDWRKCVASLERGYDTVGAHWLTPARFSFIGPVPYWGGNFFWARAAFLNELPPIDVNADRYQAEVWIGKSKRKPNVFDYARHFPMSGCLP